MVLIDSVNIEDDVMWNQAVQIIEKTVIIMQTVSDTLKMFSYSVSIVLIVCLNDGFSENYCLLTNISFDVFYFNIVGASKLLHDCYLDSHYRSSRYYIKKL